MADKPMSDEELDDLRERNRTWQELSMDDIDRLIIEIDRLRDIVNKLPKTEDGATITVGMTLFWESDSPDTLTMGREVSSLTIYDDGFDAFWCTGDGSEYGMPDDFGLYSTEAAALEAQKAQTPD